MSSTNKRLLSEVWSITSNDSKGGARPSKLKLKKKAKLAQSAGLAAAAPIQTPAAEKENAMAVDALAAPEKGAQLMTNDHLEEMNRSAATACRVLKRVVKAQRETNFSPLLSL